MKKSCWRRPFRVVVFVASAQAGDGKIKIGVRTTSRRPFRARRTEVVGGRTGDQDFGGQVPAS